MMNRPKNDRENERLEELGRQHAEALQVERGRADVTPVGQFLDDGSVSYGPQVLGGENEGPGGSAQAAPAGKGMARKVLIAAIAVVVIAAAVAAGWFMGSQGGAASQPPEQVEQESSQAASPDAPDAGSSEPASAASSSADAASGSASSAAGSANSAGGPESYVGTWEGDVIEVVDHFAAAPCYGAEGHKLVLTVKSIGRTGSLRADVKLLFHDHENIRITAGSTDGDEYIEISDLVGTLGTDGSFTLTKKLEERGEWSEVTIEVKTVDNPDGSRTLEARVDSSVLGGSATDVYALQKRA